MRGQMAHKLHNSKGLLLALLSLAGVSGCFCQAVPLPGECQCPTDARRLYCTCGEEAVRRCPCGPDREFYGLKPTCWREWPAGWGCNGTEGFPYVDRASCGGPAAESHMVEAQTSDQTGLSNPFRSDQNDELPVPPVTPQISPKQPTPAPPAPVRLIPPQATPAAPTLQKIPPQTVPARQAPDETTPPNNKSAIEKPADKSTILVIAPPKAPAAAPPITPIARGDAPVPQPMPVASAAVKMTAVAPVLIAPQNATATRSLSPRTVQPERLAARPVVKRIQADKPTTNSPAKDRMDAPALSNRIEDHLLNNLRL
jgi:hypothetical protein